MPLFSDKQKKSSTFIQSRIFATWKLSGQTGIWLETGPDGFPANISFLRLFKPEKVINVWIWDCKLILSVGNGKHTRGIHPVRRAWIQGFLHSKGN